MSHTVEPRIRAELLRDQILKTWRPPLIAGGESRATIVQTSAMQALAFAFGKDLFSELKPAQQCAIDQGVELLEKILLKSPE